jgi:transglutaminase-like putative cysteine protease
MRVFIPTLILITFVAGVAKAANEPPDWVKEAAALKLPDYGVKVTSVVLLREESVTVDADGKRVMRERGVIKILQRGGEIISATRAYNSKSGRIRDFQGWLIPPSGKPTAYGKDRIADVAVTEGLYEELRMKVLSCDCTTPGYIFAFEATEEEKTVFTQYQYEFQDRLPVMVSRFSLTISAGWEFKAQMINRDTIEPKTTGGSTTWELRDLPSIEREEYSPPLSSLAPRLVVSYFPGSENASGLRGLKDWAAVSSWLTSLVDPAAAVNEPVRAKATQLTANVSTEIEKIRAIAAFVQQTKYVAVSLNLTRGGGYTPRRSDDVLAKNYGDCKDKATLMRALLKAVGIDAYLVTITADDRNYVRPEWPSPMQFNHAIVAVHVSAAVTAPAVIETKTLGRLLMFDPTDSFTPVGDLPLDEQGSYALIVAASDGALLQMPVVSANDNRVESTVEAVLDAGGRLDAQVNRKYYGQSGVALRTTEKLQGSAELKKRFERSYSRRLPASSLSGISTQPHAEDSVLDVKLNVAVDRFGQVMQGRLLVVRPGLLTSGGEYGFSSRQRTAPVKLEADLRREFIRIKLPEGFKLDELPMLAKIQSRYGTLEANWTLQDGYIQMQETLEIHEALVPASDYPSVRAFFDEVAGAHNATVILVRQMTN